VKLLAILVGLKVAYDNDVDNIRTREKREYIQIQTAKMLLRQLKPFTNTWAQPVVMLEFGRPWGYQFNIQHRLLKSISIYFYWV
jgi:hypothetical protein